MKLSFCSIAFRHQALSLEDIIYMMSLIGYDGIEIWGPHVEKSSRNLVRIKKLLNIRGLEASMITPYFNFTGSDVDWAQSIKKAKQYISFANELNCPLIRCFTGRVGSANATDLQWEKCVDGIKMIGEQALKKNVGLAIEMHSHTLADSVSSAIRLLENISLENVNINLDIFNLWEMTHQDPIEMINELYPYTKHIHAKNAILIPGEISPFEDVMNRLDLPQVRCLKDGEIDYRSIIKYLTNKNYKYYFSIECFETRRNPIRIAEEEIRFIKQAMKQ